MKIYIDFSKEVITKVDNSVAYVGDVYSNVFELLFFDYGVATDWFPTMSQLAPNGREAGDFSADALGENETYNYVEDGVTYKRYKFTIGDGWVQMKGRSNFFIWVNKLVDTNALQRKCYGKVMITLNESTDNYFIQDAYLNPKVKEYMDGLASDIEDELNDKVESQNEAIDNLLGGSPQVFDTANNIQLLQENKGVAVATDTGQIWYWNGSAYANSGIDYQATVLANNSVTPKKTTFFDIVEGKNLFNSATITSGKTFNNTTIVDSSDRYVSDYIEVVVGKTIYFSYKTPRQALAVYKVVTYDSDKQPIAASNSWINNITIGSGVAYIRFSAAESSIAELVQAEYDSITTYEAYIQPIETVKKDNLPSILYSNVINVTKNNDNYDITMGKYTFRFYKAYSTTNNLDSYDINNIYMGDTQIEYGNILGVIKETGQDDFMGGVAHGDEQMISMNIYCDGVPITQSTTGNKIDIFLISNLKRVSDHTTNVIERIVHTTFVNNTMTIKTNFRFLVDNFNAELVYVGMWGQLLAQTTKLFTNMKEYDLTNPSNYNSNKVFNSSYINSNGVVDISIIKGFDYPNYRCAFIYYSDTQRVKNYFTLAQNETFNTNDVLYGISEYKFN